MANYTKVTTENAPRVELHDELNLTGAEITVNSLPANVGVPFVHKHKENEEIYYVVAGSGVALIDGDKVEISAGDFVSIKPNAERQFTAGSEGITYLCIQVKENSLTGYTMTDAVIL